VHRLSNAARRFKAHALIAAGLPPTVNPQESFWVAGQREDHDRLGVAHTDRDELKTVDWHVVT
jgi:hypothetical protein